MRKFPGKRGGGVILTALLPACIFFLLASLFSPIARAQDCNDIVPTVTSISPDTWVAGQITTVTVTGSNFGSCGGMVVINTSNGINNILLGNGTWIQGVDDITQFTMDVLPDASDPAETVTIYFSKDEFRTYATATAYVVPATGPIISSVSPGAWFAGRSYSVTITGVHFLTSSDPGGPTKLTITEAPGSIKLKDINVVSSTQITATVKASKDSLAGLATVTVTSPSSSQNSGSAQQPILPIPIIYDQKGNPISGDDASTQSAVVGQPIPLTTNISSSSTLPGGIAYTNTWKVGGTNIGAYTVAPDGSSATVSDTQTGQPTLNTYWVYPKPDGANVKYHYCVSVSNLPDPCSDETKATFDVSGPSLMITATPSYWSVSPPLPVCLANSTVQALTFGVLDPVASTSCKPTVLVKGIAFEASLSNVSAKRRNSGVGAVDFKKCVVRYRFIWQSCDSDKSWNWIG